MNPLRTILILCLLALPFALSGCAKTLVDRAIEARSAADIRKDNEIVIEANAAMAELGTIKASTTIYEQVLLVTGIFDDRALYDRFRKAIEGIDGVKKLHWQVAYISAQEQEGRDDILSWDDVIVMGTKAEARLIGTRGVADVNFRTVADPFGTVYLMGRARSPAELDLAVARARDGDGVRKLVNYAFVRP